MCLPYHWSRGERRHESLKPSPQMLSFSTVIPDLFGRQKRKPLIDRALGSRNGEHRALDEVDVGKIATRNDPGQCNI